MFLKNINYSKVEVNNKADYLSLEKDIKAKLKKDTKIIFYLSISPEHFYSFIDNYKEISLDNVSVVFEKPF